MILLLDNYDSFTYNIVQYLQQLGGTVKVCTNDSVGLDDIAALQPQAIVLGPGPGTPDEAGITLACIEHFADKLPLLGICLGHQAIAQVFGARVISAAQIMHGRISQVHHDQQGVFKDLPNPTHFTRYHSLIVDPHSLPDTFHISGWTDQDEIMAIRHKHLPIEGVQFHPESILSDAGLQLLNNFLQAHNLV
ncbi:anthranilate synthase component II [Psychrobacter sp. FDAARGOS_221]|uniref:anthranilate synthase component II n=1 Tax=Psychrobacter sp. FDAARGOS_221 TaxID=1975705 RepID=UPI000BB54779|nr:aminodeoxychorismate/anthranilate synthase component II [Psychrobacter sp. FDAARGOS_221]PNK60000.1 type 1 glutamine amidotransferase [Psychrobacter sp. FDAARGOS_221]